MQVVGSPAGISGAKKEVGFDGFVRSYDCESEVRGV